MRIQARRPAIPVHRAIDRPEKIVDPWYLTPDWRRLIAALVRQRGARCEQCGRTGVRIYGDHIVERRDGGAGLEAGNIQLLCGACHTAKTLQARGRRMAERYTAVD